MKVIVDANIAFSAILNTNSKIGDLLLNSRGIIDFIAPKYLLYEITKYFGKIKEITGLSVAEIEKIHYQITKQIKFISENQIPKEFWINAEKITKDIDPKDAPYVAYSDYLRVKIWTGDKVLEKGLLKKGYKKTINTNELFEYREKRKSLRYAAKQHKSLRKKR